MSPTNIEVEALEFVYNAKLWGALSLLSKFIVTFAPAGTVIVPLSNAIFCAMRFIVTLTGVGVGVGEDVTVGVGEDVMVGVGEDVKVAVGDCVGVGVPPGTCVVGGGDDVAVGVDGVGVGVDVAVGEPQADSTVMAARIISKTNR